MTKKNTKASNSLKEERERNDALNKADHKEHNNDLPGDYPADEDIMNRRDQQRVGLDVENFARAAGYEIADNLHEPVIEKPVVTTSNMDLDQIVEEEDVLGIVDELEQPAADMEQPVPKNINLDDDDIEFVTGNESDVTAEDLQALGPKDLSMDMGEDEEFLKNRVYPVDMSGKDLDIPMAEGADDDMDEAIGPNDEENDFYSLGGDRHEDDMEGK